MYRYKNQFTYTFDVDPDCLGYYCNKITLQPIIENSINHGLDLMVDEGRIDVRVRFDGDDIVFSVQDNGVGMSPEQLEAIMQHGPTERQAEDILRPQLRAEHHQRAGRRHLRGDTHAQDSGGRL